MPGKSPPPQDHLISREIIAFIIDRRASGRSPTTIRFYQTELDWFATFAKSQSVVSCDNITPDLIRAYLIHQSNTRNNNGVHASFRAIKAFLNWYQVELDDDSYRNPMRKITPPKISADPLPGVTVDTIHALLTTCDRSPLGQRDRAILITLLDTGLRRAEFLKLDLSDLNLKTGAVQVRAGKGSKDRTVYTGNRARREIIRYLRFRGEVTSSSPLWTTQAGGRLTPSGLRQIVRRRAALAGVPEPSIHDFRRAFAIQSLRNGCDLVTLMRLMGHTSPNVLRRYLHLVDADLKNAHEKSSPGDNL